MQAGHLRVALDEGRADFGLVGVVFIQVAAQGAEVTPAVLAGLTHGVYGNASSGVTCVDLTCGVGP